MSVERRVVRLTVNDEQEQAECEVRTLLSDFLRHDLGHTDVHVGCEHGVCGACTIIADGRAIRSCLVLAPSAEDWRITTVAGLAKEGDPLNPLQETFREQHGLQCGFCTNGILLSVMAEAGRWGGVEETIDQVLSGHICRCTGYVNIRRAIRSAWDALEVHA